mmetsp:Transcript_7087/g.21170  ORF Transcript_7087/g.21170 Transcript_7087/m.21170 type:complete len:210 (+) Transcript_7087:201-830(+)
MSARQSRSEDRRISIVDVEVIKAVFLKAALSCVNSVNDFLKPPLAATIAKNTESTNSSSKYKAIPQFEVYSKIRPSKKNMKFLESTVGGRTTMSHPPSSQKCLPLRLPHYSPGGPEGCCAMMRRRCRLPLRWGVSMSKLRSRSSSMVRIEEEGEEEGGKGMLSLPYRSPRWTKLRKLGLPTAHLRSRFWMRRHPAKTLRLRPESGPWKW